MIRKFIFSGFSGYIAIAGVFAVLGMAWYIYKEGKSACVNSVNVAQLESTLETTRNAQSVKKDEQSLNTYQLDAELCGLGIARGGRGCE